MSKPPRKSAMLRRFATGIALLGAGVLLGQVSSDGWALRAPPTAHKGVSVESLGVLSEDTLFRQVGLNGHVMQLREITLEPGGEIAKHSHATRPGLVWTVEGTWVEGRDSGEVEYPAGKKVAILEDELTEHWFFNDSEEPVKVVVCDIVPAP